MGEGTPRITFDKRVMFVGLVDWVTPIPSSSQETDAIFDPDKKSLRKWIREL